MSDEFDPNIEKWLKGEEDEHCEFKEAKDNFDSNELTKYCIALANEGGGYLILGISDKPPRNIIGSKAFPDLNDIKQKLFDRIKMRIAAQEMSIAQNRIIVFTIPSRPIGTPLEYAGQYYMRIGNSTRGMSPEQLKKIFNEALLDYSMEACPNATIQDIDINGLDVFRKMWFQKSGNQEIKQKDDSQLLHDAELMYDTDQITYAALVLFGTHKALGRFLPNAEVIYEYRTSGDKIEFQQRNEFREGFFLFIDRIWSVINARNDVQQLKYGLFIDEVKSLNEEVVREGLLNAISHRDYRQAGSVFIRHNPDCLEIESPGGFPPGIRPDNILDSQNPRNRRVAECFQKCGFVERSGQGADKMFKAMILESKLRPDYSASDEYRVILRLYSNVQDPAFIKFLNNLAEEKQIHWNTRDLVLLDEIRQGKVYHTDTNIQRLEMLGAVECLGQGRGRRVILSRKIYQYSGQSGQYSRRKGLNKDTNKVLLIEHLKNFNGKGTIKEFQEVLPTLSRPQIHTLLYELKNEGKIQCKGGRKYAIWILKE